MSVNHFSSNLPEALWWTQQHPYPIMDSSPKNPIFSTDHHRQPPPTAASFNFNLNTPHDHQQSSQQDFMDQESGSGAAAQITKEPMFEKPLTPSDVGKLNRLVIPKQHAEKYFPLAGGDPVDQQKGLLLSFEDEFGKSWRFRYSYWNSSQSYVLTKGWSRFVKEKRLDAGDVVLFERHSLDCDRLFIGWRRRSAAVPVQDSAAATHPAGGGAQVNGWTTRMFYDAHSNYPSHHLPLSLPLSYQPYCLHAGGDRNENVEHKAKGRRVRLFGVNLECPDESEPSTPNGSTQSSQPHYQYYSNTDNLTHNMDIDFNETRHHHHHQQG